MQVRRKTLNECKGQPRLQKLLAVALYIKEKLGRSACMKDYTINKLHTLTGISATTLKKYMPMLIKLGWVRFYGKNGRDLVVGKLCSKHDERNIRVDGFCFKSFKDVYYSLRAFLALVIQARKDFIKRTLQSVREPKSPKEFRSARKLVRRLVKQKVLKSVYQEYVEAGLGYKRIAKEIGNCVRTAVNTIAYAVKHGWVVKYHHTEQVHANNINYAVVDGYTFATRDNLYITSANIYELSNEVSSALHGMVYVRV